MAPHRFDPHGYLEEGIHCCTLEQLDALLGWNPCRQRLLGQPRQFLTEALDPAMGRQAPLVLAGSFVTQQEHPIDIVVVLLDLPRSGGQPLQLKRWTTALVNEARDHLHELAVITSHNRCEVVEALLLDPVCRERAMETLRPPAPDSEHLEPTPEQQQNPTSRDDLVQPRRKVAEVLRELLAKGRTGTDELQRLADAAGMILRGVECQLRTMQREA